MIHYKNLSDKQLLEMVIMEKSDGKVVDDLITRYATLADIIIDADETELLKVRGIGPKRVQQIKAIYEMARRLYSEPFCSRPKIVRPEDIYKLVMADLRHLKKEVLKTILLNTKNEVISIEVVSMGSLNASIVHPREVFSIAIRKSAASIIVTHNHPSGNPEPSKEDVNITKRLVDAGKIIGIELIDHVIIGDGRFTSLKEHGII